MRTNISETCRKEFHHKDSFKRHLTTCSGKKVDPVCTVCEKYFKTNWHLKRYFVVQVHNNDNKANKPQVNVNVNPCVGNPENMQPLIDLCLIMDNFDGTVADSDDDYIYGYRYII